METYKYIEGYKSNLSIKENEIAIRDIRHKFQKLIEKKLHLQRVTAPLFVRSKTGINDDLNGIETPVSFDLDEGSTHLEIVHSLAKWKRYSILKYDLKTHEGIYTNMNAIRKDEIRDNYHSIYVDQWDYEILINKEERKLSTLKKFVKKIYSCVYDLEKYTEKTFGIKAILPKNITFIKSSELLKLYPDLTPEERVNEQIKKVGALFVIGIGYKLKDGKPHDGRAPDYDDWKLNGDIFLYNPLLDNALEISSMGIRVDAEALKKQSKIAHKEDNLKLHYQQKVLNKEVPFTIGGGLGQSRICLFMLKKLHIGEVQCSYRDKKTREELKEKGVVLL